MWMPSVLCLVLFLLSAFDLLCFASHCCYLLFAFYNKCYPLSYPFVHLCLRNTLSRLPHGEKSCFFWPFFVFRAPACQHDVITLQH